MRVFGIGRHCVGQSFGNSAFELCGGGTRKGNNEHAGEVFGVFGIGQFANDAFGQNTCFTRTRGCRYQ